MSFIRRGGLMESISARKDRDYPWLIRILFWFQKRKYGRVLESAKIWARVPRLFWGVSMLYGALDRKTSPLDPELRALITVRVSQIQQRTEHLATRVLQGARSHNIEALAGAISNELFIHLRRAAISRRHWHKYFETGNP
jgi:alkylhydroperoxidase family enzyme